MPTVVARLLREKWRIWKRMVPTQQHVHEILQKVNEWRAKIIGVSRQHRNRSRCLRFCEAFRLIRFQHFAKMVTTSYWVPKSNFEDWSDTSVRCSLDRPPVQSICAISGGTAIWICFRLIGSYRYPNSEKRKLTGEDGNLSEILFANSTDSIY